MDKIMKNKQVLELLTCLFQLQNMFNKINFLVRPFESENWEGKEKDTEYRKNKKSLLEKIKINFS